MSNLQIRCVNKADRGMPHERIRYIGGFYANGSSWKFSQEEAIQKIEEGSCRFFVSIDARFLNVIVATGSAGCKYLKTEADGESSTQLLYLYACE